MQALLLQLRIPYRSVRKVHWICSVYTRHSLQPTILSHFFCQVVCRGCLFSEQPLIPEMAKSSASGHQKSLNWWKIVTPCATLSPNSLKRFFKFEYEKDVSLMSLSR